ncbi:hypothetical protein SISSUDRAFT_1053769, partial [Sistotremastrum suecicum HHB10207 ss-3]
MTSGIYNTWETADSNLLNKYVYGHHKRSALSASTKILSKSGTSATPRTGICMNFNKGTCTTSPCPYGRPHKCSTCGKDGHGASACSSKST